MHVVAYGILAVWIAGLGAYVFWQRSSERAQQTEAFEAFVIERTLGEAVAVCNREAETQKLKGRFVPSEQSVLRRSAHFRTRDSSVTGAPRLTFWNGVDLLCDFYGDGSASVDQEFGVRD